VITENGPGGNLSVHRGCDVPVTSGHLFGICSCTGWDDIYDRGQEQVRRDDAGTLKADVPVSSPSAFPSFAEPHLVLVAGARTRQFPGGTVCRFHGGASPHVASKAAVRAEVWSWGLGDTNVDPGEVLLRLVTQSAARAERYAILLEEAYDAAERLKQAHDVGIHIEAPDDELADTAETARRDLDRIFNTGEWQPLSAIRTERRRTSVSM
jgi:hypothetical protein